MHVMENTYILLLLLVHISDKMNPQATFALTFQQNSFKTVICVLYFTYNTLYQSQCLQYVISQK